MRDDPSLAKSSRPGTLIELCEKVKNKSIEKMMDTEKMCFTPDTKLIEIAARSINYGHYRLPIVDEEGKLIGAINRRSIRKIIGEHFKKL